MKTKIFFILVWSGLFFSCKEQIARKPIQQNSTTLSKAMAVSQEIFAQEQALIQDFIKKDSTNNYISSKKGFWYTYVEKKEEGVFPVKGDIVTFELSIFSLNGKELYSKEELGLKTYVIDKEHVMKGIQEGIKLMKEGETVRFLFSSFVAFKTKGDQENRIGINEPIETRIKLTNIKQSNNEH
ncbi:gliding motility-associated peptidyl-prolyl isomerase GldI [Flavicella sediminum]|uniref:gliding motility-associated peptidyl-prolyl isomerase GldI n=1 Tax=Flavicella sediminum TaxID=2585141 RepID=UPI001122C1EC|nr:gliding motility-associated peptidyl-prolyl isomerase GldI [Flavicella sediminum]